MNKIKRGPRSILLALILVALPALAFSSCSQQAFSPPTASSIGSAPIEANALQMWKDYKTDAVAAAAKYEGKDLHFARVRVDKMTFLGEGMDEEPYVQEGIDPNVEIVRFRANTVAEITPVREGYIVEIVGQSQGLRFGYLAIGVSWLKVIDPPGGNTGLPSEY